MEGAGHSARPFHERRPLPLLPRHHRARRRELGGVAVGARGRRHHGLPRGDPAGGLKGKATRPSAPVMTLFWPRNLLSSASVGLEKNCILKVAPGVLLSLPLMVVAVEELSTEVMVGLF